ncbi:MAG: hypothetical protein KDA36_13600, partial [Planctomycetaceae bacterium]|nr:hypothetical protein [Planctomycetaceae bacterium]
RLAGQAEVAPNRGVSWRASCGKLIQPLRIRPMEQMKLGRIALMMDAARRPSGSRKKPRSRLEGCRFWL